VEVHGCAVWGAAELVGRLWAGCVAVCLGGAAGWCCWVVLLAAGEPSMVWRSQQADGTALQA
jgi:hypothetical protein